MEGRKIVFHGSSFMDFYVEQTAKVQQKIDFVFKLIQTVDLIPEKFLKHLTGTDGLYEIRVECGSNIFRIFCSFDKGNLVVLFNAFQKKTQKTPAQELERAIKLMNESERTGGSLSEGQTLDLSVKRVKFFTEPV